MTWSFPSADEIAPLLTVFSLVTVRIAFLFLSAPLFSSPVLPRRVRAALVAVLSLAVFAGLPPLPNPTSNLLGLLSAMLGEAAVGASAGLTARIVFAAVEGAGQVLGVPMGLGFSQVADPLTSTNSVVTAKLLGLIVSMVFLAVDAHHFIIRLVAGSFETLPPGYAAPSTEAARTLIESTGLVFTGAIQLAAPVLVVLLCTMLALGIITRIAPKVNLLVLSFAVSIALGLVSMRAALPEMVVFIRTTVERLEPLALRVMSAYEVH